MVLELRAQFWVYNISSVLTKCHMPGGNCDLKPRALMKRDPGPFIWRKEGLGTAQSCPQIVLGIAIVGEERTPFVCFEWVALRN